MSLNSRSRSTVDYAGRTVDLLLLKTVADAPASNVKVDFDVSNRSGEPMIVTGVEKLVQRFANAFITALGSVRFRTGYGTDLVSMASKGRIYNMSTLEANAAEANLLARTRLMEGDAGEETPDDERIEDSQIVDLKFDGSMAEVKISIRLLTTAGSSYMYVIPLPIGVR